MSILGWIEDHTLGYLDRGWQYAVGLVKDAVHAVTSYVQTIFGHVGDAWEAMVAGAVAVRHALNWFASETAAGFDRVFLHWIPTIFRWAAARVAAVASDVASLAKWAAGAVGGLIARIAHAVASITRWVLDHIWTPIVGWIKDIYQKLKEWAYAAWYLVTHPQRLASLLWRYVVLEIVGGADWVVSQLGHIFVRVFLANLPRLVGFVESFFADLL